MRLVCHQQALLREWLESFSWNLEVELALCTQILCWRFWRHPCCYCWCWELHKALFRWALASSAKLFWGFVCLFLRKGLACVSEFCTMPWGGRRSCFAWVEPQHRVLRVLSCVTHRALHPWSPSPTIPCQSCLSPCPDLDCPCHEAQWQFILLLFDIEAIGITSGLF